MRYLYSPLFLFIILCYTRSIVFLVCTVVVFAFRECRWEIPETKKKRRKNVLGSNGNDGVEVVLLIRTRALSYIYSLIFSSLYIHLNRKRDGGFCYLNARPFLASFSAKFDFH